MVRVCVCAVPRAPTVGARAKIIIAITPIFLFRVCVCIPSQKQEVRGHLVGGRLGPAWCVCVKRRSVGARSENKHTALYSFLPILLMSDLWMCGMTPPPAIVALMSVSSSSSPRMASCKWRGVMRLTCGFFLGGGGYWRKRIRGLDQVESLLGRAAARGRWRRRPRPLRVQKVKVFKTSGRELPPSPSKTPPTNAP